MNGHIAQPRQRRQHPRPVQHSVSVANSHLLRRPIDREALQLLQAAEAGRQRGHVKEGKIQREGCQRRQVRHVGRNASCPGELQLRELRRRQHQGLPQGWEVQPSVQVGLRRGKHARSRLPSR